MGVDMAEPPMDPMSLEPTDAEIEEWAERERKRREAWLMGPTAEGAGGVREPCARTPPGRAGGR